MSGPLAGRAAVVAGATRGAGRAIAVSLGEAGATVYCTGRSTRGHPATPGRPETIEETAEMVSARGFLAEMQETLGISEGEAHARIVRGQRPAALTTAMETAQARP
jgi:NAD(P)-dependent dehydrogenase (short-subunit alcohol dehydrogenase family)